MDKQFLQRIFDKHQQTEAVPPTSQIGEWANGVFNLLYPEQAKDFFPSIHEIEGEIWNLGNELKHILNATEQCRNCDNDERAEKFKESLPELFRLLNADVQAILDGDPAAISEFEVIRAYPGFKAISYYRLAHLLLKMKVPLIPRILTEYAHGITGIDIHPGAEIGENFFIDHGSGIVIGGTCIIGNNVKIYQGVTLGALYVAKNLEKTKRHPTIMSNVTIYANATILGGKTVIGENSVIGGNAWVTSSVPPNSTVFHTPEIKIKTTPNV